MDAAKKQQLIEGGIDVNKALARFMNSDAMLTKYFTRFLEEKTYAELVAAIAADDRPKATMAAHTLKSVCGTLGCDRMYKQVVDQEAAMRAGNWDEAVAMMPAITEEYERICALIRA